MSAGADVKGRNAALDFLKIIASILIVCHHYQYILGTWDGPVHFWTGTFDFGHMVELFFLLSGFVMEPYQTRIQNGEKNFREFLGKRLWRLLPVTTFSVMGYCVVALAYSHFYGNYFRGIKLSLWEILLTCLGLQCGWGFTAPMINDPLWYISVLLFCYLLFYFWNYLAGRWKVSPIPFYVGMMLLGFAAMQYALKIAFLNTRMCRGYCGFFAGVLLAMAVKKIDLTKWKWFWISGFTIFFFVLAEIRFDDLTILNHEMFSYDVAVLDLVFYPAVILLTQFRPIQSLFQKGTRWISFLSGASFEVYAWHWTGILVWKLIHGKWMEQSLQSWKELFLFLVLIYLFGILVFLVFDKRAVPKIRNRISGAGAAEKSI